jgi:hypothetical protein
MKIETITDVNGNEHILLTNEDGSFTCMPKTIYDAMQAEQSTPIVTGDE